MLGNTVCVLIEAKTTEASTTYIFVMVWRNLYNLMPRIDLFD